MSFRILGTGSFLPQKVLTNDDLSHMVETSDEWITKRVGVKERRVCTTETNTDMGVAAALAALKEETPLQRTGTPEEVAQAVLCLAEQEFITGQVLGVNGGFVI